MAEPELTITVKLIDQGATLTYGLKDLNLTLRGDGDLVVSTDDGVLSVRAPGILKVIAEAVMEGIAEQKSVAVSNEQRMEDIMSKLRQFRAK